MLSIVLALVALAGARLASAADSQCDPTSPNYLPPGKLPAGHVCISTPFGSFDCPTPCKCLTKTGGDQGCFDPNGSPPYTCVEFANGNYGLAPAGTPGKFVGYCYGSSTADPLVKGFDGCAWYLHGKPDNVLNLISDANHVVNTQLVAANLTDEHHGGEGTYHGAIAVRFQNTVATARVTPEGNLTVEIGGAPLPFDVVREQSGMSIKTTEHYPYYGQVVEIVTPAFRFFIHAVQPYDTPGGWSRGHLDFSATATANTVMHGLLGQSINPSASLCNEDFKFHGEGKEENYLMADLDSVNYVYSMFSARQITRRLQNEKPMYMDAVTPLTASVGF